MINLTHNQIFKRCLIIACAVVSVLLCLIIIWIFSSVTIDSRSDIAKVKKNNQNIAKEAEVKAEAAKTATVVTKTSTSKFVPDYAVPQYVDGFPPVVYRIPTNQNVVFLGLDDGAFKDQSVVDIMKQNNIKASLFLSKAFIANNPDFFKQLIALGSVVEDHTLGHDTNMINTEPYDQQVAEICGMADYVQSEYGRRPTLFRPPGGAYSDTMLKAAAACGMKAVVTWIAKANGGSMQYQIGNKLRPGDVVLMHFRPEFKQDMQSFIDAMNAAGLHTELLEDALLAN